MITYYAIYKLFFQLFLHYIIYKYISIARFMLWKRDGKMKRKRVRKVKGTEDIKMRKKRDRKRIYKVNLNIMCGIFIDHCGEIELMPFC